MSQAYATAHSRATTNSLRSAVVNLSLITATLPRIHSYLAGLQAGLLSTQPVEEAQRYRRQLATMSLAP